MRLGILGPVLVLDDAGCQIRLAGRQRTLLAALLVHANRTVPVDDLAELIWDGAPPGKAGRTVRSYVVRLRRDLGPAMAARLVTQGPAYSFRVQESELDTLRFEALCRATSEALPTGAWAEAAAAAAQALETWRDEPLQDVPSQLLRELCAPRLEQLRLQASEDHAEAQLHLGRHESLVPQLRVLTAAHPLRERFHVQLMTALARSGRRAEALDAYQHARTVLVEELGIEPGPELRAAHQRVLSGESESEADLPADTAQNESTVTAVPRQLPAAPHHFTGRQVELDRLTTVVERTVQAGADSAGGTVVISAIDGMAGIGKTALAIHAAHQLAAAYPDGQLFIDLHGYTHGQRPCTAEQALEWLLRALGVPAQRIPEDSEQAAALYRQRLADTRTLIVLDNAVAEAQVRPLLPGAKGVPSRKSPNSSDAATSTSTPSCASTRPAAPTPARRRPGPPPATDRSDPRGRPQRPRTNRGPGAGGQDTQTPVRSAGRRHRHHKRRRSGAHRVTAHHVQPHRPVTQPRDHIARKPRHHRRGSFDRQQRPDDHKFAAPCHSPTPIPLNTPQLQADSTRIQNATGPKPPESPAPTLRKAPVTPPTIPARQATEHDHGPEQYRRAPVHPGAPALDHCAEYLLILAAASPRYAAERHVANGTGSDDAEDS